MEWLLACLSQAVTQIRSQSVCSDYFKAYFLLVDEADLLSSKFSSVQPALFDFSNGRESQRFQCSHGLFELHTFFQVMPSFWVTPSTLVTKSVLLVANSASKSEAFILILLQHFLSEGLQTGSFSSEVSRALKQIHLNLLGNVINKLTNNSSSWESSFVFLNKCSMNVYYLWIRIFSQ